MNKHQAEHLDPEGGPATAGRPKEPEAEYVLRRTCVPSREQADEEAPRLSCSIRPAEYMLSHYCPNVEVETVENY